MRILLLGATGMVGQGVLRECLLSPDVEEVVAPVRQLMPVQSDRLRQVVRTDFFSWNDFDLAGFDACFFCLGVTSVRKTEAEYRKISQDLTLALAKAMVAASPQAIFVYVSGAGTDATSRAMWARVKGETELALLQMPFRAVYCFRPGYIQPLHGIRSKTGWYNAVYRALDLFYPALRRFAPDWVTSTEAVGLAMLHVARTGWTCCVLGTADLNAEARCENASRGL